MTSVSFRDSMNGLGWSRREPEVPANTSPTNPLLNTISNLNPFGKRGYVQLPTHEAPGAPLPAPTRREEEEGWFARKSSVHPLDATVSTDLDATVSRWDRMLIFGGCNLAALACFVICFALFPVLSLKPRKFAIL